MALIFKNLPDDILFYMMQFEWDMPHLQPILRYKPLLKNYVERLVPRDESNYLLVGEQVANLPNLVSISSKYTVKITRIDDLLACSLNANLKEASFDIFLLQPPYLTGGKYLNKLPQTTTLPVVLSLFFGLWPSLEKASGVSDFNFTFQYSLDTISVSRETLIVSGSCFPDIGFLLETLSQHLPIKSIHGLELNAPEIREINFPYLEQISVINPDLYLDIAPTLRSFDILTGCRGSFICQHNHVDLVYYRLATKGKIYPKIEKISPVPISCFLTVKRVFPNLIEISLVMNQEEVPWSHTLRAMTRSIFISTRSQLMMSRLIFPLSFLVASSEFITNITSYEVMLLSL